MIPDGPSVEADHPARPHRPLGTFPLFLTVFLLVVTLLGALSWDDLTEPRYEHIDFAANSLLIDEALSLDLLHGNYSRTGFYHPGPALLYVQAGAQLFFHDLTGLVPTPYNAHLLGIFILNAALLALAACIAFRATGSLMSVGGLVISSFVYSLLLQSPGLGGLLSSTWMPHVYVWPFLLLLVGSASVAAGEGRDFWVVALAGGILVHGHVSFVLPVLVIGALVLASWVYRHRGSSIRAVPRPSLIAIAVVLGVFILPLALQLITDFPGQYDDYIRYIRDTDLPPRGLGTVTRFIAQYWGFGAGWLVLIPALVLGTTVAAYYDDLGRRRNFHLALISIAAVASVTTLLYGFGGVDDFTHTYLALFYVAVPIAFWTILSTSIFERWVRGRRTATAVIIVLLSVVWIMVLLRPESGSLYNGSDVGIAYESVDRLLETDEAVALSFSAHDDWAVTVGFLEQARRDGRRACARVGPGIFETLFTPDNVCSDDGGGWTELFVTARDEPPEFRTMLLFDGANYDIWRLSG